MSTQYRLVQSGKTASGGCSAGPRFARACSATDYYYYYYYYYYITTTDTTTTISANKYIKSLNNFLCRESSIEGKII
jgi:hypothetical protein